MTFNGMKIKLSGAKKKKNSKASLLQQIVGLGEFWMKAH